ncbi:MAG: hypothetical protein ACXVEF_05145 [Polyangiales bacterium]
MIRSSSFFVLCALALGCSSSDDGGATTTDTGTTPTDTGTASDDTGTSMTDSGSMDDSGGTTDSGSMSETSGDTGGGPSCSDYCSKVLANCKGATDAQYFGVASKSDSDACNAMCAKMTPGTAADTSGDTVGCRLSFATAAASSMPGANCRKAGPYGGAACGADRCNDFCKLALAQCPSAFTDTTDCKTKCTAMPYDATKPEVDPTAVGKLNCVFYHLEAAYSAPASHCGHLTITTKGMPCTPP